MVNDKYLGTKTNAIFESSTCEKHEKWKLFYTVGIVSCDNQNSVKRTTYVRVNKLLSFRGVSLY